MSLLVRRPKVLDLPAIEQLEAANLKRYPSRAGWLDSVRALVERTLAEEPEGMMIADLDGKVAGLAIARMRGQHPLSGRSYGQVVHLSVHPQHRSAGVGERLLRECEAYLRSRGCEDVLLRLPVDQTEDAELFKKTGYQVAAWELQRTFK
ncbi:MAG: GNAT family N-acetyltransferase [Myxococcota bacterium]